MVARRVSLLLQVKSGGFGHKVEAASQLDQIQAAS